MVETIIIIVYMVVMWGFWYATYRINLDEKEKKRC